QGGGFRHQEDAEPQRLQPLGQLRQRRGFSPTGAASQHNAIDGDVVGHCRFGNGSGDSIDRLTCLRLYYSTNLASVFPPSCHVLRSGKEAGWFSPKPLERVTAVQQGSRGLKQRYRVGNMVIRMK